MEWKVVTLGPQDLAQGASKILETRPRSAVKDYCAACLTFQGGKTFCARFCARLIAASRRAVLTVFVCHWESSNWDWKNARDVNVCYGKAFLSVCFFFSSLENYFGFRTTNVKGKTDHSVSLRWNKKFWTFPKRLVFFWLCIRLICELISPSFAGLS